MISVVGWTGAFDGLYQEVSLTENYRKALIERIRKRRYDFSYNDHLMLPFCVPYFSDNTICVLSKFQWESVMKEAYKDSRRTERRIPMDVITTAPKNGVLYEKEKYKEEFNSV